MGDPGLRFEVSDTGVGIPPESVGRLFQRFSQVDNTIGRTYGGTGLGLAICKQIVELMGGAIGVESISGAGSTFWFEVPLESTDAQETKAARPMLKTLTARVLVVDDVALNREIARTMLEAAGCEVAEASGGVEAVELVQVQRFDVVLMDLQMPELDGLDATRLIRSLGHDAATTPVIAMTANVLPEQVKACLDAGMDGHVGKPFRRDELLSAVAEHAVAGSLENPEARAPDVETATPVLDLSLLEPLMRAAGPTVARQLLESLTESLANTLLNQPPALDLRGEAGAEAHGLLSAAGSLGFSRLSQALRRLETACNSTDADPFAPWGEAQAELKVARDEIQRLLTQDPLIAQAA